MVKQVNNLGRVLLKQCNIINRIYVEQLTRCDMAHDAIMQFNLGVEEVPLSFLGQELSELRVGVLPPLWGVERA